MGKPEPKAKKELTPKMRLFVEAYLRSWNATQAAKEAGYEGDEVTLASIGYENLRKPQIKALIKERLRDLCMSTDEWFVRTTAIARGDIGEFLENDGTISLRKARAKTTLLSEYQVEESYRRDEQGEVVPVTKTKIKLYSAKDALKMIGQRLGLLESDTKALLQELKALFARHQFDELRKKEALLELLKDKASPETLAEVERILTRRPTSKGRDEDIELDWDDMPSKEEEEDPASEASLPPEENRP